ncbi:MAG: hypothetical protein JNM41_01710 [Flavipsychrobacter sp.]|nr:hypothetical protein [Flavipsychrobacter sp.]
MELKYYLVFKELNSNNGPMNKVSTSVYLFMFLSHAVWTQCCFGQHNTSDSLFYRFRKDIQTEQAENHGKIVLDVDTRESYYLLLQNCATDFLLKYVDDSSPVVRVEIFAGLVLKGAEENLISRILNKHSNDTAKFTISSGDVAINWSGRDYMQMIVNRKDDIKLTEKEINARVEKIRDEKNKVLAGIRHGIVAKGTLLLADSLNCPIKHAKIRSFTITVREKTFASSNVFTKEIKRQLGRLRSGDRFLIDNIIVEGEDKTTRLLVPVLLKIE